MQSQNCEIIQVNTRYCTLYIWLVVVLLSDHESRAIINDQDVILHGFMLEIIHSTDFPVKRFYNLTENREINSA